MIFEKNKNKKNNYNYTYTVQCNYSAWKMRKSKRVDDMLIIVPETKTTNTRNRMLNIIKTHGTNVWKINESGQDMYNIQ